MDFKNYQLPLLALLIAIAITSVMDFSGLFMFSALPLILVTAVFWFILRLSKKEMGLHWGKRSHYGLALLYPFVVLGITAVVGLSFGEISLWEGDWSKKWLNIIMGSTIGIIMVVLTEEGFFRGWLWGALRAKGFNETQILWLTSLGFTIWHISAVTSSTDYGLPWFQIPIYLINAMLLGLIWGSMRSLSGSIVVPAVSHAVWNALAYEFFGFGQKVGALGIEDTIWFGPEVGVLGIILNGAFFYWMWKKVKLSKTDQ